MAGREDGGLGFGAFHSFRRSQDSTFNFTSTGNGTVKLDAHLGLEFKRPGSRYEGSATKKAGAIGSGGSMAGGSPGEKV